MNNKNVQPNETEACCCVDFGTVIDNSDCTVDYNNSFASRSDAEEVLAKLTQKARSTESDPCEISSSIEEKENTFILQAKFIFACATERMIFQLALR